MIPKFRNVKELQRIIKKYLKGNASLTEKDFLHTYYDYLNTGKDALADDNQPLQKEMEEAGLQAIKINIAKSENKKQSPNLLRYVAAAAILVILMGSIFYYLRPQQNSGPNQLVSNKGKLDVLPGKGNATLTLADGSEIFLDEQKSKDVLKEHGLAIAINAKGELVYEVETKGLAKENNFHTLKTAKGNQFQIILSDGTKVWLNALSSLRFPEAFGQRRVVELIGEGYFEVAKDKNHPFIVKTQQAGIHQEVEVLGTKFNINSYLDESVIKTTLIEGSVKVSNEQSTITLSPLTEAKLNNQQISNSSVDVESAIAWKNGDFSFSNASLKSILNQMARWYDIEIDQAHVPHKRYNGVISRNVNLSEVLNMLSLTGNLKFELTKERKLNISQIE